MDLATRQPSLSSRLRQRSDVYFSLFFFFCRRYLSRVKSRRKRHRQLSLLTKKPRYIISFLFSFFDQAGKRMCSYKQKINEGYWKKQEEEKKRHGTTTSLPRYSFTRTYRDILFSYVQITRRNTQEKLARKTLGKNIDSLEYPQATGCLSSPRTYKYAMFV